MLSVFEDTQTHPTRRRALWIAIPSLSAVAVVLWKRNLTLKEGGDAATGESITLIEFSDTGVSLGAKTARKIIREEAEWRQRLTPQQYYVTRVHSTDFPFTGTYYQIHDAGLYRCICCETALFSSDHKYDSGTGWPSFWSPIAPENIQEVKSRAPNRREALDRGIEILCSRCDAHLGHIFGDGPEPTNLRYCINESSLKFVARFRTS